MVYKKTKNGIILFITILLLLFMSSIVMIFLKNSDFMYKDALLENATIQTNVLSKKILDYVKQYEIKEQELIYLSNFKMPLKLNEATILITVDSKQSKPSINNLIKKFAKDRNGKDYYQFIDFMSSAGIRSPDYLMNVLIDSVDSDLDELAPGSESEIALKDPKFNNGNIRTAQRLRDIFAHYKRYYDDEKSDELLKKFEEVFSFSDYPVDLNFARQETLEFFLPYENSSKIEDFTKSFEEYKELKDIPLSDTSKQKLEGNLMGSTFVFNTDVAQITIEIENNFFKSSVSFDYYLKSKIAKDQTINFILLK